MKFFVFFALALLGASAAPRDDTDVAGDVTEIINAILDLIPEPLLDLHDLTLSLDLGVEQLNFTFVDVVLSGIKNLEITTLDYDQSTGRLDYVLTFGKIETDVEFDLILSGELEAVNHPVVKVELDNYQLTGYAVVDTDSSPHKITDFKLLIVLEEGKVDLTGILNDDALTEKLNTLLNKELANMVNDINVLLEPFVSPLIKSVLNIVIKYTS